MRKHLASMIPNDPVGVGNAAVDPYAAYLVYDTFTDDDDTALASHTPDKDSAGNGWVDDNAGFQVSSNQAHSTTTGKNCSTIDTGNANVDIRTTITIKETAVNEQGGIMFRADDFDNGIFLRFSPLSTPSSLTLTKRAAASETELAQVNWSPSVDDVVEMKIIADDDDLLTGYLDGVEKLSNTNTYNNTNPSHGLYGYHAAGETAHLFDDFNVAAV